MKKLQLTISQILMAMTVLALLSMLLLSFVGLRNVQQLNEGIIFVADTGQAVRRQMDADMMHDAIRSDVLGIVLASRDGQVEKMKEIQDELGDHPALAPRPERRKPSRHAARPLMGAAPSLW